MTGYRPQPLWILVGPLLGGFAGAAVGTAMMLAAAGISVSDGSGDTEGLVFLVLMGASYGGVIGAVVGVAVGIQLTFLVGAHLPAGVARRRACVLGSLLTPLTMLAPFLVAGDVTLVRGDDWWLVMPLVGGAALGGPLAAWIAGRGPARRAVS